MLEVCFWITQPSESKTSSRKRYLVVILNAYKNLLKNLTDGLLKNLDDSLIKSKYRHQIIKIVFKDTLHRREDSNMTPVELDRSELVQS